MDYFSGSQRTDFPVLQSPQEAAPTTRSNRPSDERCISQRHTPSLSHSCVNTLKYADVTRQEQYVQSEMSRKKRKDFHRYFITDDGCWGCKLWIIFITHICKKYKCLSRFQRPKWCLHMSCYVSTTIQNKGIFIYVRNRKNLLILRQWTICLSLILSVPLYSFTRFYPLQSFYVEEQI